MKYLDAVEERCKAATAGTAAWRVIATDVPRLCELARTAETLLRVADCPSRCTKGGIGQAVYDGEREHVEWTECQFCGERKRILAALDTP